VDELDRVQPVVGDDRVEREVTPDRLDVAEVRLAVVDEDALEVEGDQLGT
jgi:hypothetical protein